MNQILHILKFKFLAYIRLETKLNPRVIFRNIGSGLIYTGFAVGAFFFSQQCIRFLLEDIHIGLFLLHSFISMVLFIFFVSVNVGNIIVSYSTLYKSDEVAFFFTKPIEPQKIFFLKFMDNFFYSSSTLLMILFSLLAGYVYYFKLSIVSFIFLVLNFIPFILSAGSLGVIILLFIIKLANRFGIKNVIAALAIGYISAIVLFFKLNSPQMLITSVLKLNPLLDKNKYFGEFIPPIIKYLPNNWLSQTAYWIVQGNVKNSLSFIYMQFVLSAVLFSIALILGNKWYFNTWLLNQKITSDYISTRNKKNVFISFESKSDLKGQTESIFKKDILIFIREPGQIIHLSILLFLTLIFIWSLTGIRFIGFGNIYLQTMIYLSIFLFNLLLITTLSLRFIFPLISLEGEAFWKIKSAPMNISNYVKAKLWLPGIIILLISLSLGFFSNYKLGLNLKLLSIILNLFAAATIISINFGMGGLFANYKEKNAIRLSSSQGATLSFLINILFMLILIAILFSPLSELFLSVMLKKPFKYANLFQLLIPVCIISSVLMTLFFRMAVKSLRKDF
jgi:ABC-2 type transport system permease protein